MTTGADSGFLAAIRGAETATAPVWLMRQAGRYLPEYRSIRERVGFWELVTTPELAAEVTLQPLRRFGLDAAILFSDIMTPLPSMGMDIEFQPGPLPVHPLATASDVAALRLPEPEEIAPFVSETIALVRSEVGVPLIGFAGAPLTLAAYLVRGGARNHHAGLRAWLRSCPEVAADLFDLLTEVTIRYLRTQVDAGAQAIQLFDSWAGVHCEATFVRFGLPWLRRIFEALADCDVPRIYLAIGAEHLYPHIATLPVEAVGVDWRVPLSRARARLPGLALQGNLDPATLLAPAEVVAAETVGVLEEGRGGPHVFNLGHGLLPSTPVDAVARMVDVVRGFRRVSQERA